MNEKLENLEIELSCLERWKRIGHYHVFTVEEIDKRIETCVNEIKVLKSKRISEKLKSI